MKVLHLVGSQQSEYYYGVSVLYAPGFLETFTELTNIVLLARLDGTWSIPKSLDAADVDAADRMTLPQVLQVLQEVHQPDIMQPHMFCYKGMTTFRYIADILDIPIVGCSGATMALATDKWQSRAVVSSMGVPVPKGQLLRRQAGDTAATITMEPPFILKPCREDNSMGITLVKDKEQIEAALQTAFTFDDLILCEEFIPLGRELRVGVIESADGKSSSLEMLPVVEYFLGHKAEPIRTSADKLTNNDDKDAGNLSFAASGQSDRKIPADIDPVLEKKLHDLAVKSHEALGCDHYSLYDVRVSPQGEPYFIEACTYCSFSPKSVIVSMGRGESKYDNKQLFYRVAERAIKRHQAAKEAVKNSTQKLGMRTRPQAESPTTVVSQ